MKFPGGTLFRSSYYQPDEKGKVVGSVTKGTRSFAATCERMLQPDSKSCASFRAKFCVAASPRSDRHRRERCSHSCDRTGVALGYCRLLPDVLESVIPAPRRDRISSASFAPDR